MSVQSAAADVDVDLRQLFASLARNWLRILVVTLIVTGLAFAFAWLATPHYKATTQLKIQLNESAYTRPAGTNDDDKPVLDAEGVATEVQVISSSDILNKVAEDLNLGDKPEFNDALGMSPVSRLLVIAGLKSDPQEIPLEERVLMKMRDNLNVKFRILEPILLLLDIDAGGAQRRRLNGPHRYSHLPGTAEARYILIAVWPELHIEHIAEKVVCSIGRNRQSSTRLCRFRSVML